MLVTAEFIDVTGAPVVNIDFAETLAKRAGFKLVSSDDLPEGHWQVIAPEELVQNVEDTLEPIGVVVSMPDSEETIGVLVIRPKVSLLPRMPQIVS